MDKESDFYLVKENAYKVALPIVKCPDTSEDISQNVCIKYFNYKDKIECLIAWSRAVAKNEAINYLKVRNKEYEIAKLRETSDDLISSENETEEYNIKTAKQLLDKKDFDILKLYLKHNKDVELIARKLNKSKSAVYDLVYRMKKNYTASVYLKKGWRGTKKIISYNMHRNIERFLKELQKKIKDDNLPSMKHYFVENIDFSSIRNADIAGPQPYKLVILKNGDYRLWFVYVESVGNVSCMIFDFKEDRFSKIKIYDITHQQEEIYRAKISMKEAMKHFKPLKNGLLQETLEESQKIDEKLGFKKQIRK